MSKIKFYFDENIELAVSVQLTASGFDVVSVHSLGSLSDPDEKHLMQATQMGRVLCTYDTDFLSLVGQFPNHAGVVFAYRQKATIGGWVCGIRTLHGRLTAEEIVGQVIYLQTR